MSEAGAMERFVEGRRVLIAVGALALAFVAARSFLVPIAHDEALTFNLFVPRPMSSILGLTGHPDVFYPTNHPLNSALMKISCAAFGPAEWALRLPNVAAFALFLGVLARVVEDLGARPAVLIFAFVATNPFLLDLFSAARGYGLGLSLLLLGTWWVWRGRSSARQFAAGAFALSLSLASNLCYTPFVLALLAVLLWADRQEGAATHLRRLAAGLPAALVLAAVYGRTLPEAVRGGRFYVGGTRGFLYDTLPSLLAVSLYRDAVPLWAGVAMAVGAALLAFFVLLELRRQPTDIRWFILGTALASVGAAELLHALAGARYPTERMALGYLLFGALALAGILSVRPGWPARGIRLLMFAFVIHSVFRLQFDHFLTWRYDARTRDAFERILEDVSRRRPDRPVSIATALLFEPSLNYYRTRFGEGRVAPVVRGSFYRERDYYYLPSVYDSGQGPELRDEAVRRYQLAEMARFPDVDAILYARRLTGEPR